MYTTTESEFIINRITPAHEQELTTGFYIVVTNALAKPPHLGLLLNGKLYSISVKGPSVDADLATFLRTLKTRNLETIFIQLSLPADIDITYLQHKITESVLAYSCVDVLQNITCISPIKAICKDVFNIEVSQVHVIFDLLPKLHDKYIVVKYYSLNLNEKVEKGKISLTKYTLAEVNKNIAATINKILLV